jgi:hypothetical protein
MFPQPLRASFAAVWLRDGEGAMDRAKIQSDALGKGLSGIRFKSNSNTAKNKS